MAFKQKEFQKGFNERFFQMKFQFEFNKRILNKRILSKVLIQKGKDYYHWNFW